MTTARQTKDILENIHDNWINPHTREVWIQGSPLISPEDSSIEPHMATKIIKNLLLLQSIDSRKPIVAHLYSCGGCCDDGMAIYDTVRALSCPVVMIGWAGICSMATIVFQAANKRILMPNSYFMFHMGSTGIEGTPKKVHNTLEFQKKGDEQMFAIYIDKLKKGKKFKKHTAEQIREELKKEMNLKEDVYLTAEEAVHWGFADQILTDKLNINKLVKLK